MTEELQAGNDQGLSAEASKESPQPVTSSEKMVPQSVVDRTVQAIKKTERERGRQEAMADYQRQQEAVSKPEITSSQPQSQTSMGGMGYLSPDEVRQMIEEHDRKKDEAVRAQSVQEEASKVSGQFFEQLNQARSKYSDFEEMEKQLDISNNTRLAPLIIEGHKAGITNMGDVIYDLWKNPAKVATLAGTMSEAQARAKLRELADSLKANEAAKSQPTARKPLSQMQVSMTATDNGTRTISDFRRASWARA